MTTITRNQKRAFYKSKTLANYRRYAAFDGVNDYISLNQHANAIQLATSSAISIECWVRPHVNTDTFGAIFTLQNDDAANGPTSDVIYFAYGAFTTGLANEVFTIGKVIDGGTAASTSIYASTDLNKEKYVGQWVHVVFVITQNAWRIYINKVSQTLTKSSFSTGSQNAPYSLAGSMQYATLGARLYTGSISGVFPGDINRFRVWSKALTVQEITEAYDASYTEPMPNLLINLPLNGNANDSSGNGYNGTPYNGVTFTQEQI